MDEANSICRQGLLWKVGYYPSEVFTYIVEINGSNYATTSSNAETKPSFVAKRRYGSFAPDRPMETAPNARPRPEVARIFAPLAKDPMAP